MKRRVDLDLAAAVRRLLPKEPERPLTGGQLRKLVQLELDRPVHLRRIGLAVAQLREQGVPVWSGSGRDGMRGYRIATTDASLIDCARGHERRALESLRVMRRLRNMTFQEFQQTMRAMWDAAEPEAEGASDGQ